MDIAGNQISLEFLATSMTGSYNLQVVVIVLIFCADIINRLFEINYYTLSFFYKKFLIRNFGKMNFKFKKFGLQFSRN